MTNHRFEVTVRVDDIAAGHYLPGYEGACQKPHGHNWHFTARVGADALHRDMVVDFVAVKAIFKQFDHTMLNDHPGLCAGGRTPTVERLVEYCAEELERLLSGLPNRPRVLEITAQETGRNAVTYRPAPAR